MRPSKILLSIAVGFLCGVGAGSLLPFSWGVVQVVFLVIFSFILAAHTQKAHTGTVVLIVGMVLVGYVYAATAAPTIQEEQLALFSGARSFFIDQTEQVIGGEERGMFLAMVLGWRDDVSQEIKQIFNRTGTRHVLAISGMHLTIVAAVLLQLLVGAGLTRQRAFWAAIVGIVLFVFLVGTPPSAVRAAIMAGLYLTAQHVGRMSQAWRLLIIAAAAMVAVHPAILIQSVGFQLSFSAVLGIILFKPFFDTLLAFVSWRPLRDLLSLSLAAQITTWPLLAGTFGRVSLIGPLANLVAVPLLPIIMLLGLAFLFIGWTSILAAKIILYPAWALLHTLVVVLEPLSRLPWAEVSVGTVAPILFMGYYLVLAGVYWWGREKFELAT